MLKGLSRFAAAIILAAPLGGCISLAIGDNSSGRDPECTRCGRDLEDQLCRDCQAENWSSACAECAKLGQGKMCPACQEKAGHDATK
jgi:hypothetical protein